MRTIGSGVPLAWAAFISLLVAPPAEAVRLRFTGELTVLLEPFVLTETGGGVAEVDLSDGSFTIPAEPPVFRLLESGEPPEGAFPVIRVDVGDPRADPPEPMVPGAAAETPSGLPSSFLSRVRRVAVLAGSDSRARRPEASARAGGASPGRR